MSDKIEYSRLLMKRSTSPGEVPTVPPVSATTLNQFTPTDVFVGEFFLNAADDLLWIRTDNGILPIDLSGSTGTTSVGTLTQVLYEGNVTNGFNIEVSSGDTIIYSGLTTGTSQNLLAVDTDGRTIIVTGTTNGTNGTSGTSGTGGSSGTSGSSGSSGTSGSSGSSGTSGSSGINGVNSDGTIYGRWYFTSGSTAYGNPGTGRFITNSVTPSDITQISIDDITDSSINFSPLFDLIGNAIGLGVECLIQMQKIGSEDQPLVFAVSSYSGDTSWRNFGVSMVLQGATTIDNTGIYSISFELYNATAGTSGTSGTSGSSGSSGTSGSSGSSGTSGSSGVSGSSGTSGTSGLSGETGSSGSSGTSGSSGISGSSGTSGSSGVSGSSGTSGSSGVNGDAGTSGTSGVNGSSGTSGANGDAGSSGTSGSSGVSGSSGTSGSSGSSGLSGVNGTSGTSGMSGATGNNGTSGTSGVNGDAGSSGTSGASGTSGVNGANGTSGTSGPAGSSGTSGTSGGGGGGGSTTITGVTLSQTGWTFNSPYYEYEYTNADITGTVAVLFTPYNSSVITSVSANVYPYIELNYSTNTAKITADYAPTGDITGQFIIF